MLLLTPGPLTTSARTRSALPVDHGSRSPAFDALTAELRQRVTALVGPASAWATVPLQGSGTFAVEAMLGTFVRSKVLVLVNGAYGRRMATICERMGRPHETLVWPETQPVEPGAVREALAADPSLSHVAVVHCETTTGLLNPLAAVAEVVAEAGRCLLIDAMSAFGALPLSGPFEAVAASSNKCLEGVPGIGLVIARRSALEAAAGRAPSLSLDLAEQHARFERDGQWRFTPPVQVVAGFVEALRQHAEEGGVEGRGARYRENLAALVQGMRASGFQPLLPDELQAPIIVTFLAPPAPWAFRPFYDALLERGFSIYPGKLTERDTFRVGCIGHVRPDDLRRFVAAVKELT